MTRSFAAVAATALAILTASPAWLLAQADPDAPGTSPTKLGPMLASIRITGVSTLVEQWPQTVLGRLAAEPDVATLIDKVVAWHADELARRDALMAAAIDLRVELERWPIASMFTQPDLMRLVRHPPEDLRRADLEVRRGDSSWMPHFTLAVACQPHAEGRWTREFDRETALLGRAPWFRSEANAKIGGFPASVFLPLEDAQQQDFLFDRDPSFLMQRLPGLFIYGAPVPDGQTEPFAARPDGEPGVALTMYLDEYRNLFQQLGGGVPAEFEALGFDGLDRLEWRGRFVGKRLLDEFEMVLNGQPKGLVEALLTGTAALPPQPLPDGALAQLRAAIDLKLLLQAIERTVGADALGIPPELVRGLPAIFDGGVAFGICAPAPGGAIPRMLLTMGLTDEVAFDRVVAKAVADGLPVKQVEYDGVACWQLTMADMPQGLQPTLCKLDGQIHIAESGRSLRQFLKVLKSDDAVAMDVGDAPVPDGEGEILASLDLRFDEVETYRAFRDTWMPLIPQAPAYRPSPGVVRDDMPTVDVIAKHCGKSRGVLRKNGTTYTVQHLGGLGGPEFAALLVTWGPIFAADMGTDYLTNRLEQSVASATVANAWAALEAFKKREQRWPRDLAELFAAEQLAKDALLLPADDLAEEIQLHDGSTARSSFRYFPKPLSVDTDTGPTDMLLVAIQPQRYSYSRTMLSTEGTVPEVWGQDPSRPIDELGGGASPAAGGDRDKR